MINHGVVQGDRSSHLTSGPYQVALAIVSPEARFGVEQAPDSLDPALSAIMDKVSIEADDALLAHFPRAWPARVEVRDASTTQRRLMVHIPGDPERPFSKSEVLDKFMRVVAPLLGEERAGEWAGRALGATATIPDVLKDLERGYCAA
jgi:2-methylcitrate dehydratase PrpD